jgi:hypothetical protein
MLLYTYIHTFNDDNAECFLIVLFLRVFIVPTVCTINKVGTIVPYTN